MTFSNFYYNLSFIFKIDECFFNSIITRFELVLVRILLIIIAPFTLIIVFGIYNFFPILVKLDKLNGSILTNLLKNVSKYRKCESVVFMFS